MKITQVLKPSVYIILDGIGGISDARENELLNLDVPLPNDIKIVARVGNVPKDISAFFGVWEEEWTYNGAKHNYCNYFFSRTFNRGIGDLVLYDRFRDIIKCFKSLLKPKTLIAKQNQRFSKPQNRCGISVYLLF